MALARHAPLPIMLDFSGGSPNMKLVKLRNV
jgi:hypothetical protein